MVISSQGNLPLVRIIYAWDTVVMWCHLVLSMDTVDEELFRQEE